MKGNILIFDANVRNLRLLKGILEADGYETRPAAGRKAALEAISERLPDLILMAVTVPDTDTFEFCRRLRGNPTTSPIPVIFLGGLARDNKLKAFAAGSVDYIIRPFAEEELLARVNIHFGNYATQRGLMAAKAELHKEVEARKLAEETSLESSFRLFQIMQMISVPTFVIDTDHSITHWNSAMERLTGIPAIEMIGTRDQWRIFYTSKMATLADIIADGGGADAVAGLYGDKVQQSALIEGAYEVERFFPSFGLPGKWYFITAAPLLDSYGEAIGAIETVQDVTERKNAENELKESEQRYKELSITDSLTKLYNSRHFFRQLVYEVNRARRYKTPLSLILMDIDDFKRYNDSYGHPEGDLVLKALAGTIKNGIRNCDTAYRYGGEEFTVILPETGVENAFLIAERLRRSFEKVALSPRSGTEVHMTISIGVGSFDPEESTEKFLKRVDEGMYRAKREGKNRVCIATDLEPPVKIVPDVMMKQDETNRVAYPK